ncbi:MAG: hypothetical protein IH865_07125 [Chloroflexi bacterium]|nr:hypothetical protein [Chloroflexota bacterium]
MAADESPQDQNANPQEETTPDVGDRLVLPLMIPVIVFLFTILVIYGLSRIYLELNDITIGTVTMATPLAIGVSLFILFSAWYLASNRRVPMWQTASIGMVAVAAVTGGAIWAAVDDRGEDGEPPAANGEPTPGATVEEGTLLIGLIDPDWAVTANPAVVPAGDLTLSVENQGTLIHNLRVIRTDLNADQLPIGPDGFTVDEANLNVVLSVADLRAGESEETGVTLEAGGYVLLCNIPGHYDSGMRVAITVE